MIAKQRTVGQITVATKEIADMFENGQTYTIECGAERFVDMLPYTRRYHRSGGITIFFKQPEAKR